MESLNKNFAVVYAKKTKKRKKHKLDKKLKLYKTYSTVELATIAIINDPVLKELTEKNNIYIIEIVEE